GAGIISKGNQYEISINASGKAVIDGNMPVTPVYSNVIVPLNKWVLITGMLNIDGTATICVDAFCKSSTGASESSLATTTNSMYIGYGTISAGTTAYFNGSISNVQVYNSIISPSQVMQLYQEGINGEPLSNSGLQAWYPLNGNAKDYSGNNNNGTSINVVNTSLYNYPGSSMSGLGIEKYNTSPVYGFGCNSIGTCNTSAFSLNNAPLTSGEKANFNGQNSYIAAPVGSWLGTNHNFTVAVWYYSPGNGGQVVNICTSPTCGSWSTPFIGYDTNGSTYAWINGPPVLWNSTPFGKWYFAAITYATSNSEVLYINGKSVSSATGTYSPSGTVDYATIGADPTGQHNGNVYLNGSIANVQIYDTTLSSNSIKVLYQRGMSGAPISDAGLQAWYPLNGNAQDYGPNNYDGVANNVNFVNSSFIQSSALDAFNISKAVFPKSVDFNGQNGYIVIPHSSSYAVNSIFSMSWWFSSAQPSTTSFDEEMLSSRQPTDETFDMQLIGGSGSELHGDIGTGTGTWLSTSVNYPFTFSQSQWYNVITVFATTGWSIFLDGKNVAVELIMEYPASFDSNSYLV
ncbi:LamG domain protein jellyroll fold domain protein, partial [mine drainage metagenome]